MPHLRTYHRRLQLIVIDRHIYALTAEIFDFKKAIIQGDRLPKYPVFGVFLPEALLLTFKVEFRELGLLDGAIGFKLWSADGLHHARLCQDGCLLVPHASQDRLLSVLADLPLAVCSFPTSSRLKSRSAKHDLPFQ
eukprot:gb/GEZN01017185.1/.p1 GENE.gb/GEZN01017185.1/~~gb/GEZN01017185.1/.p1  ORF type:complete len:136 (+),score=13.56 gb/GEZN01017185.1/:274-681(+)